jgi:hypothetical protein
MAQISSRGCPARLRRLASPDSTRCTETRRAATSRCCGLSYPLVHDPDPRRDLDMASYGVVKMLPSGPGTGYHGLGWEPKLAFGALARADGRA